MKVTVWTENDEPPDVYMQAAEVEKEEDGSLRVEMAGGREVIYRAGFWQKYEIFNGKRGKENDT